MTTEVKLSRESEEWLASFKKQHGFLPRILHIGNIANNAYINAKILNCTGIDSDVLCYDYYHIMGCPEWEDADFEGNIKNHFSPRWHSVDLGAFKRPKWFAQGPLVTCIHYLLAKRADRRLKAWFWWKFLGLQRHTASGGLNRVFMMAKFFRLNILYFVLSNLSRESSNRASHTFEERASDLSNAFAKLFPGRPSRITADEIKNNYMGISRLLQKLFSRYDVIQGYATDGIFPLLANVPYVAFEHGTIRNIPFEDTTQGQLCALTYKLANRVCVTNADNIVAAKKLGLDNYDFVPHPINQEFLSPDSRAERLFQDLHNDMQSDFIIFHPSRHHWEAQRHPDWEKGNDIFIRGFARFVKEVNPKAAAIFIEWGKTVAESRRLLEELHVTDRAVWLQPMPNRRMVRYIYATDLLADQFYLGAFGSTMPKALACGKPAMLYLNYGIHKWCFAAPPPVINARTEQEVFEGLVKVYSDKARYSEIAATGKTWYKKYHSNEVVANKLILAYKKALSNFRDQ